MTEKVQLLKSAILIGDVSSPSLSMEEGTHIQGQIDMVASPWVDESTKVHEDVHDLAAHRRKQRAHSTNGG